MPRIGLWALGLGLFALAVLAHPDGPASAVLALGGIGCMLAALILNVRGGAYGRRGQFVPGAAADAGTWGGGGHAHDAGMIGGDAGSGAGGDFGGGGFFGGGDFGGGGGGDGGGGG